jgi:hypothetical protein
MLASEKRMPFLTFGTKYVTISLEQGYILCSKNTHESEIKNFEK